MVSLLFLFIKQLFSFIDKMVIFVIKYLYQLIVAIADTNVFGNLIYDYLGRIYMFLSVFMVFKLSISIINYVINPDALSDKSKGFGKLITNVVISLILLAITPNLFNMAFNLQTDILNSNAIYQIITGKKLATVTKKNNEKTLTLYENARASAEQIAFGVYSGFVYQVEGEDSDDPSKTGDAFGAYCEEKDVANGCGKTVNGKFVEHVCGNTTCLLDGDTVTNSNNKYWWLISTACGCVVVYILLGFCIDTAVRSVKLGFLQIIAPIPIMLRMDPSGKDDKFQKWLQETIKTFISLFIRLAALFFATEIIRTVMTPNNGTMTSYAGATQVGGGGLTGVFVQVFIVIGCLLFAKQFPQLLSDILGIKLDGDGFSLKKKMGGIPGLGAAKVIGAGALGFAGGAAANAYAGIKGWDKTKGFWSNANRLGNSMATGAFSGAFRGARSNEKNMFKAAGAGVKGSVDARNLRAERNATGDGGIKGWGSRRIAGLDKFAGVTNDDTAKIAAQRQFGEDLWNKVNSKAKGYESKYSMGGNIGSDFGKAWKTADDAKDYRNKINSQLSMARSDFQAGKEISWGDKKGAAAIAALEVESAKASAAYDKASADFKELRSMQEHKTEATYYDAYNAADDRHSAESYANKTFTEYSSSDSPASAPQHGPNGKGDPVAGRPNPNTSRKKQRRR